MGWYNIFLLACIPLAIVPPVFIYNHIYEDGIFGRAGLVGISSTAWLIWLFHTFADEGEGVPMGLIAILAMSFAVFLTWHLFRFHTRVLRQKARGFRRITDA